MLYKVHAYKYLERADIEIEADGVEELIDIMEDIEMNEGFDFVTQDEERIHISWDVPDPDDLDSALEAIGCE